MKKRDLKLITAFIAEKSHKKELNFAKVEHGAIIATDTRKAIKFNFNGVYGDGLIHKKLLKGVESTLGKDEKLFFENGYFHTDEIKLAIDTGYFVEDEKGKNKIGAKSSDYPNLEDIFDERFVNHFALESIEDLQFELTEKNCFIDESHLNGMIAFNDCTHFDIYYEPQRVKYRDEKKHIETAKVKIVAKRFDDSGVEFTQFVAVMMGREFESKADKISDKVQRDVQEDELYEDAKKIVIDSGKTSISYLQRMLQVGYNRTARIVEQLETNGVISEPNEKGTREVL